MSDPVPAISEAAATGEIAAIFADIRAVYGVGAVNLIWRHLATIEGALPWAWASLRPLYAEGFAAAGAGRLRAARRLPAVSVMPVEVLRVAGVTEADHAAICAVLDAYERTNAMALVALTRLRESLRPGFAPGAAAALSAPDPTPMIALPPLLALDAMPPPLAALVQRLNCFGAAGETQVLASMYRHLAHWPPYLALCWGVLAPLEGALPTAVAAVRATAAEEAARLASHMPRLAPPAAPVAPALELFLGDAISRMVVVGGCLRAATPEIPGAQRGGC